MISAIAVYNNKTKIVKRLKSLCLGEPMEILEMRSRKALFDAMSAGRIQIILLDIMIDAQDWEEGIRLIRDIRRQSRIPVLVLSGQESEKAKIDALSAGADDYVNAGDNPLVLMARIKSQLRRYYQLSSICRNVDRIYRVDGLEIDDTQRRVTVDGTEVRLTPIEYQILVLLAKEKGRPVSISQIYEAIWRMDAVGADNTIAVHIRHIREKIEQNPKQPRYLKVIWGIGYMVG